MSGPVDDIDKFREPVENYHQPVKRFSEHIVLVTIVVLAILVGMAAMLTGKNVMQTEGLGVQLYSMCFSGGAVLGATALAFLSDVYGRKPTFIAIAAGAAITSLCLMASNTPVTLIGLMIYTVSRGGFLTLAYLTVTEYCTPKHRLPYLIATVAAMSAVGPLLLQLLYKYVVREDSIYLQVVMLVFGIACLGSACLWPESPYWLIARDRRGDAACSLRRLRGHGAEPELSQLQRERRSPGPLRLYWRSLLVVLIISTIVTLNELQEIIKFYLFNTMRTFDIDEDLVGMIVPAVLIPCLALIIAVSYFVKRKTLYISCCGLPIVVSYIIGFWLCSSSTEGQVFPVFVLIFDILRNAGTRCVSVIVFTEIVPYKYNTHISCVRFLYMVVATALQMLVFSIDGLFKYPYILVFLIATLSAVLLGLAYWLAPETKDLTLIEIQKLQAPQYNVTCPEQNETMMQNIHR